MPSSPSTDSLKQLDSNNSEQPTYSGLEEIVTIEHDYAIDTIIEDSLPSNEVFTRAHQCLEQLKSFDTSLREKLNKIT
jgi:molecular chaperone GrpE (heat shock protein)